MNVVKSMMVDDDGTLWCPLPYPAEENISRRELYLNMRQIVMKPVGKILTVMIGVEGCATAFAGWRHQ